ncbi:MAG: DUF551 domain-containing protein [Oscillospiraceae bacterium]|nr:DUF551 domain-containing protein [Bacteroidaceae bacterium]MBP0975271.1 DUF551 domain-containing protein [Oscillospiraceae bacterium]MBP0989301.1 DUF551 domain-containing protein [Oscillospiraceae bacterium]
MNDHIECTCNNCGGRERCKIPFEPSRKCCCFWIPEANKNDLEKVVSEVFDRIMSLPVCENEDQRKGRKEVIDILRSVTGNDFGWISCDDRLPEEGQRVIVCYYGSDMIIPEDGETVAEAMARINQIPTVTMGCLFDDGWAGPDYFPLMVHPSFWMQLPAPPEVKKEGEAE